MSDTVQRHENQSDFKKQGKKDPEVPTRMQRGT